MLPARILLVHGALADGSSWSKVIPTLQAAGHNVTAVQQPLTSIPNDVAVVKNQLAALNAESDMPIVVAGHSFGGFAITNAVTDAPNIKALVYVMGFAPDEGETVTFLEQNYTALPSNQVFVPNGPDGRLLLTQPDYLKYFAPDVNPRDARVLAATQGPLDGGRFTYPSGPPAWRQVKNIHYIVADEDQMIPPALESWFAKRMKAKTTVLKGASHAGLISQADKVAKVILDAANGY